MSLLVHSRCPKPVQISSLGTGTPLSYAQISHTADLETMFSPAYYYEVGTSGNALKWHISVGLWLDYLQTSLFISIYQTAVGMISPVEFAKEASHFHYKFWENNDLTVQPVINYIYSSGRIYASCLFYFSNHSPGIEQKQNWNVTQALEKIYLWHFIICRQLVLSPF